MSSVFAYAMAILVSASVIVSSAELVGTRRAETASGALVVGGGALTIVLLVIAIVRARVIPDAPLPPEMTIGLAVVASLVGTTAAWRSMHGPHTRALSMVIALLGVAALVRVGAWEIAAVAGEKANPGLYAVSRGIATVAVVTEALAQLAAAMWIGTRGRVGVVLTTLAAVLAFAVTWGAAAGGHGDAPRWASVLHTAMADAATLPVPFGLSAVQSFLTGSAIFLALAAIVQPAQPAAIVGAVALALVSRGAFDAPLRALSVVAASTWMLAASFDDRILWAAHAASRERPRAGAAPNASTDGAGGPTTRGA
jgi:hypothetical protein